MCMTADCHTYYKSLLEDSLKIWSVVLLLVMRPLKLIGSVDLSLDLSIEIVGHHWFM